MEAFITWLQSTSLSQAIVASPWLWPFCETIHFIGLALVLGCAGFFDLRLMGFMRRVPVAGARMLMPWATFGFLLNLTTGLTFFIGHPEQYFWNIAWWLKVFCLFTAGLNAFVFERFAKGGTLGIGAGEDTPRSAKVAGAVSLAAWMGVLYWGRMLPFIGDAF